jgi:[acyl-carrier-protein] S-malonyltransferase
MRSRLLILCPGQGGQNAAMFDLPRSDLHAAALLDSLALPADGDIFSNRRAQPAIVAAGLAMWAALRDACPAPALVAGYSIGELTAYGIAGAFSAHAAVALAARRAELMDACVHAPQAMLAFTGPRASNLAPLLAPHGFHVAIETGEDSIIAGGPASGAAALTATLAGSAGSGHGLANARVQVLPVAVASHTPLMAAAVAQFAEVLRMATWSLMDAPVVGGIDAALVQASGAGPGGVQDAIEHLSRQLAEPIRWMDCMDAIAEQGITAALELGPGSALSKMLSARHPHIECRSASDFRTLDGIRRWLERIA